jgi:hypothetical protein
MRLFISASVLIMMRFVLGQVDNYLGAAQSRHRAIVAFCKCTDSGESCFKGLLLSRRGRS